MISDVKAICESNLITCLSFSVGLMSIIIEMMISFLRTLQDYVSKDMRVMIPKHRYCYHGNIYGNIIMGNIIKMDILLLKDDS